MQAPPTDTPIFTENINSIQFASPNQLIPVINQSKTQVLPHSEENVMKYPIGCPYSE